MNTIETIERLLLGSLSRAGETFASEEIALSTLRSLGWSIASLPPAFGQVATAGQALRALWDELRHGEPSPTQLAELAARLDDTWSALATLATMPAPSGLEGTAFVQDVARDLVDLWLIEAVETETSVVVPLLALFGLVEIRAVPVDGARQPRVMRRIYWERVGAMLADPAAPFRAAYAWGGPDFDAERVLVALSDLLIALRHHVVIRDPDRDAQGVPSRDDRVRMVVDLVLSHEVVTAADVVAALRMRPWHEPPRLPGLAIEPVLDAGLGTSFPLGERAHVEVESSTDVSAGFVIALEPGTGLSLRRGETGGITGRGSIRVVIDEPTGTRRQLVSLPGVSLSAAGMEGKAWFGNVADADLGVELTAHDARIAFDTSGLPGVLRRVVGDRRWETSGTLGVGWSLSHGLFFGGGGLDVAVPISVTLGPVVFEALRLGVTAGDRLRLSVTTDGRVALGPVTIMWRGLGGGIGIRPPQGSQPGIDIEVSWETPMSLGLAVDAGAISGGGAIERNGERYTGALALEAFGLALSAIGALDTAGGGYSLVAVISAEFSPIRLPMGFTLDGVGGLIGIHRRVDTDALRAALRGPGIGDIFFAADPNGQAARLTGDLGRYFPAAEGRYVFGPAVKFGWGVPTIITGTLAVLLELPSPVRIVILGSVSAALPSQDHAIIDLNVDVVGEIDFGQKRVAIDASLRDSTIAGFAITGDLALRMRWGDQPSFALAIGGFHSQFRAPPDFPALRRIQIPIGSGDNPRLDIQGFLALTSNTAQVGAQAELYAAAGPLNIRGSLGFETLIVFSPFSLQVDVWAGVKLRRGNSTLAGIHFDGRISGPGPWRIDGKACLSLWFIDLCVPVHVAFGSGQPVQLPARSIWPALQAEIARPESWSTELPPGLHAVATTPPMGEAAVVRIDPGAALTVRQKVVPLDRPITRFAQGRPEGRNEFRVSQVRMGETIVPSVPVTDWFAPAQFEELSDADKLSRPGFERMTAGLTVGGDEIRAGAGFTTALEYETIVWADGQRQTGTPYRPSYDEQLAGTAVSSVAQAPLRTGGSAAYAPPPRTPPLFVLNEETYVIASTIDLQARPDLIGHVTRGQAELALRAHLASAPGDAGRLQVVPSHEVAA